MRERAIEKEATEGKLRAKRGTIHAVIEGEEGREVSRYETQCYFFIF